MKYVLLALAIYLITEEGMLLGLIVQRCYLAEGAVCITLETLPQG